MLYIVSALLVVIWAVGVLAETSKDGRAALLLAAAVTAMIQLGIDQTKKRRGR